MHVLAESRHATLSGMLVGIDEVGRGCWAGPLVAAAVALNRPLAGLNDSKKLSKARREQFDATIRTGAAAFGIGWVNSEEVDELGLTEAVRMAMQRALAEITCNFEELIIDGNYNFLPDDVRARAVVAADGSIPAVSAASIIAKVARDKWMREEAAKQFPVYQFEKHVGYGTKLHQEALRLHGVCALHRLSYKPIRAVLEAVIV
jgi:ribonuclease HII